MRHPTPTCRPRVLDLCDPVVANELEAAALSSPPRSLVVTLGSGGARWSRDGDVVQVAAPTVDAVDTTGAGDAFAGTLAAAIADGAGPLAALERAVAAGTAAVTRPGAQDWALDR
jgi:ribokinase